MQLRCFEAFTTDIPLIAYDTQNVCGVAEIKDHSHHRSIFGTVNQNPVGKLRGPEPSGCLVYRCITADIFGSNIIECEHDDGFAFAASEITEAGALVIGQKYQILSAGDTDFKAIGADDNNRGTVFVPTGAGSGTGRAFGSGSGVIDATGLVAGSDYQILSVGNTDFTAIGVASNVAGTVFTATGAGTGTTIVGGGGVTDNTVIHGLQSVAFLHSFPQRLLAWV